MKKCDILLFLFLIAFLHFSCKKPDITPAYLVLSVEDFEDCIDNDRSKFNRIHDTTFDNEEWEVIRQQQFKDVFVTLNGKSLGYWPLPCKVPLLPDYSSLNNIEIIPCVRVANTTHTTRQYRFLKPVTRFLNIEKDSVYRFSDLKFEYRDEILFPTIGGANPMVETFMQGTRFDIVDSIYPTTMTIIHDGERSMGKIALEGNEPYFNVATPYFTLDLMNKAGRIVQHFWEISYKCDNGDMMTYLSFRNTDMGPYHHNMVGFRSTKGEWKRAYIDITDIVTMVGGYSTQVSMRLGINGFRASSSENAYFYFENMKLISGAPH